MFNSAWGKPYPKFSMPVSKIRHTTNRATSPMTMDFLPETTEQEHSKTFLKLGGRGGMGVKMFKTEYGNGCTIPLIY